MAARLTQEEFLSKVRCVHGDTYDYPNTVYTVTRNKITVTCKKHGDFLIVANKHLQGHGCQQCSKQAGIDEIIATTREKRPDLSHVETPPGSKAVPVGTKGDYALVDEEDYERVMQYNWSAHSDGYIYAWKAGLLHRFIMNPPDDAVVDHIAGVRHDNRKSQLRVCSQSLNSANRRETTISGKSRFIGVSPSWGSSWVAYITHNYKRHHLGSFPSEEAAAKARDEAAKKYHKDFARLNFPNENSR